MHRVKIILLFLYLFMGNICCAYVGYLKDPFVDIPNFREVDEGFYRGGQPTAEGMERLERIGGHFEIESEVGSGTKVTLKAPLKSSKIADESKE